MGKEIEHKFLVKDLSVIDNIKGVHYRQGYLSDKENAVVRVRIAGDNAFLTIKGRTVGASRIEFEYEIPVDDAYQMLEDLIDTPIIDKTRYKIPYKGFTWEVDVFYGDNEGLIIAEVEIPEEGHEFEIPDWIGKEVTNDKRYYNSNLIQEPFNQW